MFILMKKKCATDAFLVEPGVIFQQFSSLYGAMQLKPCDTDSVSDDYLEYILLQFPTNVTGWICHTLVTSTLLKACETNSGR